MTGAEPEPIQSFSSFTLENAHERLRAYAARINSDPLTNSVFALAQDIFSKLQTDAGKPENLEALIDFLFAKLLTERADRFRDQHFPDGADASWTAVDDRLERLADSGYADFSDAVSRPRGGFVLTGHPTFAMSPELSAAFANYASTASDADRSALAAAAGAENRVWLQGLTLLKEHEEVQNALSNARGALRTFADRIVALAAERFPDDWRTLAPRLPTLASWVGYDLDGRTDIHWSQSFAFRLSEKSRQLAYYIQRLDDIAGTCGIESVCAPAISALSDALAICNEDLALFSEDLTQPENLVRAANFITQADPRRLISIRPIQAMLGDGLAGEACPDAGARALIVLRAEMETFQLGTARIHLRLNAAQIRSVISTELGLETEDAVLGRTALRKLAAKASDTAHQDVNFADLFLEPTMARRQFLMCAQILKHIDGGSPIRFLIAESENPATVMGALYMARQYGIDHALDIAPLFETPEALEIGGRFVERLLEEESFVAYLRRRGQLSIQLGFSDSGRFIGQIAGNMAIERIHNLIGRALAKVDPSIGLLLFNTHGESMGRGAYPGGFAERFDHALTPWTRSGFEKRGLKVQHEVSIQGGDGYLHFGAPQLAEATISALCQHLYSATPSVEDDPFYTQTLFVWDFYRALRNWHERLFRNQDYGRLLSDFAFGFVSKAGSRQTRRPGGSAGPRSLRAISHNATLQQLGVPLNTACGVGSALRRETDRLADLAHKSPRMMSLMRLAIHARNKTSLPALRGYGAVYNPGVWLAWSRRSDPEASQAYRKVSATFRDYAISSAVWRITDLLSVDLDKFDDLAARITGATDETPRHEGRLDLHVLHSLRQAVMMDVFATVARLPATVLQGEASQSDLMESVAAMQIDDAVLALKSACPLPKTQETLLNQIREPSTLQNAGNSSAPIHSLAPQFISPLETAQGLLHKLSLSIACIHDAYG